MQVSVESPSKIERRVTIVVPVERLDTAYDQRIMKLSQTAKINGFRAGKIPLDVIRNRFGETARQEALSEVIQASLYQAMDQEKLKPVDVPTVEPKTVIAGQPLEFVATFEVLPHIEEVHFKADQVEKWVASIKEEDINKVIDHLRNQHKTWKKVSRPAQIGDRAIIDFVGTVEGIKFQNGEAKDYPIILGSKMMVEGFEEGLVGMKEADQKTLHIKFPENYFANEVAGKETAFAVTVKSISEPELPEVNEAFIKKMGVQSGLLEDFHKEVQKNLDRENARVTKARLKSTVFNLLIEQNPIDIPKGLIDKEAKRLHDEMHPHHVGKEHTHTQEEEASFKATAKDNMILGLLVAELIKKFNLTLDKERVKEYIQHVSAAYENPKQIQEWYARNKKNMAEVEMLMMEEQVLEKLLESIKLVEKQVSYKELINNA